MASRTFKPVSFVAGTDESSVWDQVIPITGWLTAVFVARGKVMWRVVDAPSGFVTRIFYQVATTNPDEPSAWSPWSGSGVGPGRFLYQGDLSTTLASVYYVRFGVAVASSSDGTYEQGEITGGMTISSN